jgi:hypothetical protein
MEQVTANVSGKVRRVRWDGRDWLVAPASMLVEGVLNGSQGPLFYPDEEIRKSPDDWNGMPITFGHPTDDLGRHVSARRRDVLDRIGLGTVFEANHNGKLVSEAWFDEERTRRLAPPVLASLTEGRPLELSTGLFTRNEPAPAGSSHNGKPYTHVARGYRPDHLAVLVGQKGACSIADGCGVLVNEAQAKTVLGRLLDWAAEALGGADGVVMAVETAGGGPAGNAFCPTGAGGGQDNSCSAHGGGGGGDKAGHGLRTGSKTADAATQKAEEASARAGSGSPDDHRRAAKAHEKAAGAHEDAALSLSLPAANAGIRAKTSKDPATRQEADATSKRLHAKIALHDGQRLYHRAKAEGHRGASRATRNSADEQPTDEQRRLGHDALVQKQSGHNPPSWAVDEALWEKAKEQAAKAGHEEDWAYVVGIYQQMGGKIEGKPVGNADPASNAFCPTGEGGGQDNSCSAHGGGGGSAKDAHAASKQAEKLSEFHRGASSDARGASNAAAGALKASASRAAGKHENAALFHEQAVATHRAEAAKAKPGFFRRGNAKAQAEHEKAAAAHEHAARLHKDLAGGKSTRNSEGATMTRDELLARVTANCGDCDDDDRAAFARLSDAALAALAGNAGMACPPGMDPEEWAKMTDEEKKAHLEKKGMTGNTQTPDVRGGPTPPATPAKPPTINEWLAAMPPEARGVWDNAVAIERRERTALVDRLVANVQGEPKQALAKRLSGKPLDELRELTALLPPPAEPQQAAAPHYWGAAGAPAANAAKDDSDNLLPEVTLNFDELAAPALRRKQAQ